MKNKIISQLREISAEIRSLNISAFAASTAFFLLVSLVPMLVLVCAILPYTPLTERNLMEAIVDLTPDIADVLAESLVHEVYTKSAGVLSIAVLTTLWSAGKGVLALMRGLNVINGVEEKRNYFLVRLVASFYTLVLLVIMILSLFIMVFGNELVELVLYRVPQLYKIADFIMHFRFIPVWAVLTVLFAMIYAYIPNKKLKFREQTTGAIFTAIVWSVFSWGFSLYVENAGAFSIYGSLAIFVFIMVWLYICMYIVMLGAYLNRFQRYKEEISTI